MSYYRIVEMNGKNYVSFLHNGRTYTIDDDHANLNETIEALRDGDYKRAADLYSVETSLRSRFDAVSRRVKIGNEQVLFDGQVVDNALTNRILEYMRSGESFKYLVNFMEKLYDNSSEKVRNDLFRWIDSLDTPLTITSDGDIVAYKGVMLSADGQYVSISQGPAIVDDVYVDGHVPNNVGSEVVLDRSKVVADSSVACASGLHAGTWQYASGFARGAVLIVKIDPADVVSVPTDCNGQKIRTCRYIVLDVLEQALDMSVLHDDADDTEEFDSDDSDDSTGDVHTTVRFQGSDLNEGDELRSRKSGRRAVRIDTIHDDGTVRAYFVNEGKYRDVTVRSLSKSFTW